MKRKIWITLLFAYLYVTMLLAAGAVILSLMSYGFMGSFLLLISCFILAMSILPIITHALKRRLFRSSLVFSLIMVFFSSLMLEIVIYKWAGAQSFTFISVKDILINPGFFFGLGIDILLITVLFKLKPFKEYFNEIKNKTCCLENAPDNGEE